MKLLLSTTALVSLFTLSVLPLASMAEEKAAPPAPNAKEINDVLQELKKQSASLNAQEQKLNEQRAELDKQQQVLEQQRQNVEGLQRKLSEITGVPVELPAPRPTRSANKWVPVEPVAGVAPDQETQQAHTTEEVGTDRKPPPQEKPPEIAAVIEEGGVLLPKGKLVITPSTEYSRSSATRVAIEGFAIIPALNIGSFEVTQIGRDTFTEAVSARLGITNKLEIDAKIPWLHRSDLTRGRPIGVGSATDTTTSIDGQGLGDIEAGIHYQFMNAGGWWPYMVANVRFKSDTGSSPFDVPTDPATGLQLELPTGSGFYAIQPSVTFIYPSDPAVFFSNIGYLHSFGKSFPGVGKIQPGDSISSSFGMSLSINDKSSLSFGYGHSTVLETERNGVTVPNSTYLQVGTLDLGYTYSLTDFYSVNLSISAGVTEDAPDSRITLRIPVAFQLF